MAQEEKRKQRAAGDNVGRVAGASLKRMDDTDMLTETERLLLMSAAVLGLGPSTNLSRANTAKVALR
jgi:hypothetical protein